MWRVTGKPVDPKRFLPFEPLRVLNYYDGPRIFTLRDSDGGLCLAVWSEDEDDVSRFLIGELADETVAALEGGALSVRAAMNQPSLWVIDLCGDGTSPGAWQVAPKDVPEDAQPRPGTKLHRQPESVRSSQTNGTPTHAGESLGLVRPHA